MPTANHEVTMCECGHGHHVHTVTDQGGSGKCIQCSCQQFREAAVQQLREGEQRRRLTED